MAERDRPSPPGTTRLSNLHDANWSCVLKSSFSLFSRNSPSVFHGHPNSTRQPLLSSKQDSSHLFPTSGAHPPWPPATREARFHGLTNTPNLSGSWNVFRSYLVFVVRWERAPPHRANSALGRGLSASHQLPRGGGKER